MTTQLQSKNLNFTILTVYYLFSTLPHEWVGVQISRWRDDLDLDDYNRIVLLLFVIIALSVAGLLFKKFINQSNKWPILRAGIISLILCFLVVQYLFVLNVEIIHFLQYAILAVLIYPLCRDYRQILLWTLTLGVLDEAYQYFYLAPFRTNYFDFNDVLADVVGGTIGLVVLKILGKKHFPVASFLKSPWFICNAFLTGALIILYAVGIWGIYPESEANFLLVKRPPTQFWSTVHPGITYHILRPWSGVLCLFVLVTLYPMLFDEVRRPATFGE